MENTDKNKAKTVDKPQVQTSWEPRLEYLRSVTLKAAIRENRYVDRRTVEKHWHEANAPESAEKTEN